MTYLRPERCVDVSGQSGDKTNCSPHLPASHAVTRLTEGDRVRVDIPDTTDPDYDQYHGRHGTVVSILEDSAETVTGDERDSTIYRIEMDSGETADFRWRDLRPPIE